MERMEIRSRSIFEAMLYKFIGMFTAVSFVYTLLANLLFAVVHSYDCTDI